VVIHASEEKSSRTKKLAARRTALEKLRAHVVECKHLVALPCPLQALKTAAVTQAPREPDEQADTKLTRMEIADLNGFRRAGSKSQSSEVRVSQLARSLTHHLQ